MAKSSRFLSSSTAQKESYLTKNFSKSPFRIILGGNIKIRVKIKQKQTVQWRKYHWIKKSFKYQLILTLFITAFFILSDNIYANSSSVVINEIQTAGLTANDEFIELHNNSSSVVDISDWSIQYRGGSGASFYKKNFESGDIINSSGYFLIAHGGVGGYSGSTALDMSWSQSFSSTGGTIFLVSKQQLLNDVNDSLIVDKVGYGTASSFEFLQAMAPSAGKSIERENFQDTNNNSLDFSVNELPTPKNALYQGEVIDEDEEIQQEDVCIGNKKDIILNEIYPNTEDEKKEFIEIKNIGTDCVDVSGWAIKDSTETSSHKTIFPEKTIIESGAYFYIEKNLYLNNDDDTVYLLDESGLEMDKCEYKKAIRNQSYGFFENKWLWTMSPTKGEENIFKVEDEILNDDDTILDYGGENKKYSDKIQITELFPNPFQSEYEEYVELYNGTPDDIDLIGWTLRDGSKTGKYTFAQSVILKAQKYLAIFKKDFKFALNNSGDENVTLSDPNGKEVSKASYDGSKKNVSYNFDGARWRWSKFLTPGAENILNNEPYGKIKIDKKIFKNSYANFSVSTGDVDGDKVKVTWDFGDGHKSYLSKTRHKYEETGNFNASVKLSDGSEDVVKTFIAEVKKYPHPKVRIVSVNANPEGSDTIGETLMIENKSKEKISLEGWSIATGSKTLSNHPIAEKFILKKKETREITREISKFTLNNKKGKIELRYPDGEVADKIKYEKKEGIKEGEIYKKIDGGWEWVGGKKSESHQSSVTSNQDAVEIIGATSVISNQSSNANTGMKEGEVAGVETKKEYSFVMLENDIVIGKLEFKNSDARVFSAETFREVGGQYLLTFSVQEKPHYAVIFFNDVLLVVNLKLNTILNYFN